MALNTWFQKSCPEISRCVVHFHSFLTPKTSCSVALTKWYTRFSRCFLFSNLVFWWSNAFKKHGFRLGPLLRTGWFLGPYRPSSVSYVPWIYSPPRIPVTNLFHVILGVGGGSEPDQHPRSFVSISFPEEKIRLQNHLGGGNSKILVIFIPTSWGFMIQFDGSHISSDGLVEVQPPNQKITHRRLATHGRLCRGEVNPCVILGLVLGNLVHPGGSSDVFFFFFFSRFRSDFPIFPDFCDKAGGCLEVLWWTID